MLTPQELSDAFARDYGNLIDDVNRLAEAEKQHGDARLALLQAKQSIVLTVDAKDLGANEATRTAEIAKRCSAEADGVLRTESLVTTAKNIVEKRRILIDNTRYQLRCAELAANITNGALNADETSHAHGD